MDFLEFLHVNGMNVVITSTQDNKENIVWKAFINAANPNEIGQIISDNFINAIGKTCDEAFKNLFQSFRASMVLFRLKDIKLPDEITCDLFEIKK